MSTEHLTTAAAALLDQPVQARIEAVRAGSWIPYPQAERILRELEYVLTQPPSDRMTGVTLVGPTNNGKSSVVRRFLRKNRRSRINPETENHEFLYVETPPAPSETTLLSYILVSIGAVNPHHGTMLRKLGRVMEILPTLRTRMILLDESQNVLAGSDKQKQAFLNTLKSLSNRLEIPLVLIGTEEALQVISRDRQVLNRYPALELPPWPLTGDYERLLGQILRTFPLREPSNLSRGVVEYVHVRAASTLGGSVQCLQRAAVHALRSGKESIDLESLRGSDLSLGGAR